MLKTNIRDLLARYYAGEVSTCKICGKQGVLIEGEAVGQGELELFQHEFRTLPYGVQVSKYAICSDCKRQAVVPPIAVNGTAVG